jgi:hypothetical protein
VNRYQKKVLAALGAIVGGVSTRDKLAMRAQGVTMSTGLGARLKGFVATLLSFFVGGVGREQVKVDRYKYGFNKAREDARYSARLSINRFSDEMAQQRWDRTWTRHVSA